MKYSQRTLPFPFSACPSFQDLNWWQRQKKNQLNMPPNTTHFTMEFLSGITWKERILSFPYLMNNWLIILQMSQTIPHSAGSRDSTCVFVFCEVLEDCESWTACWRDRGLEQGYRGAALMRMSTRTVKQAQKWSWDTGAPVLTLPQSLCFCKTCVPACIMGPHCISVLQTSFCLCSWPKNATQYSRWSYWKQEWAAWSCGRLLPLILPEDSGKGSVSFLRQAQ